MEHLITIVVPIYNVEKYLKECIDSILGQTYKNLQIILVDDGSTDKSSSICDNYAKQDKRIEVIHKENGGLSDARNTGIKNARGEFICFIDSDDFINYVFIEELYRLIKKYNSDISIVNFKKVDKFKQALLNEKSQNFTETLYTGKQMIENIYNKRLYVSSIVTWNKMYKTSLFKDVKFPCGKINEDEYTTYKLLYKCKNVIMSTKELYYYRFVQNSIMNKKYNENRLNIVYAVEERMKFFKEKGEEKLYNLTLIWYLTTIMIHYQNCKLHLKNSKGIQNKLIDKYKKNYKEALKLHECKKIEKIKIVLFRISPFLYYNIRKYAKKLVKN